MPDTGLLLPGSASQGAGWLNPTNLLADDGAVASSNGTQTSSGNLRAFNYTFGLPNGIYDMEGIQAEIEVTSITGTITLNVSFMTNGTAGIGVPKTIAATGVHTLGGEGDLWSTGITPDLIISQGSSVGLVIQLESLAGGQASIDYAKLRLFYGWKPLSRIDWSRFPK